MDQKCVSILCVVIFITYGTGARGEMCKRVKEVEIKNIYFDRNYNLKVAVEYKGAMLSLKHTNHIPCNLTLMLINLTYKFKVNIQRMVSKPQLLKFTVITDREIVGDHNIILAGRAGDISVNQSVYYKDFQPEILNEGIVSTEDGKQMLTVVLRSNPFYLTWKIDNMDYIPGEEKNGIEALKQKMVDKFTFNVSLLFSSLDKKALNHHYVLVTSFPKTTFYHSFRIGGDESKEKSTDFQAFSFGIGISSGLLIGISLPLLVKLVRRCNVCRQPKQPQRLLNPLPEPEPEYAVAYSWRNRYK